MTIGLCVIRNSTTFEGWPVRVAIAGVMATPGDCWGALSAVRAEEIQARPVLATARTATSAASPAMAIRRRERSQRAAPHGNPGRFRNDSRAPSPRP